MTTTRAEPRSVVALVPARAGSKRIREKNIRRLGQHPLLAYTIVAARASGLFESVLVSTDSSLFAEIASHYGAEAPFLRPTSMAQDTSPDVEWVRHALLWLRQQGRLTDCFSLLRPTSPFRQPQTIRRAWTLFSQSVGVDSLRAVEKCSQHPGKMWVVRGERMHPLLPLTPPEQPWHSSQYQALPEVYVQNASLEIAWCDNVLEGGTIAGVVLMPFFTEEQEGFDVNKPVDWLQAEHLLATGQARLPEVPQSPYELEPSL